MILERGRIITITKHFTTLLALLLSCSMLGQFIPQPMGYNPDANGDSFIGADDVMGTLALYGNIFSTNDSTEFEIIDWHDSRAIPIHF